MASLPPTQLMSNRENPIPIPIRPPPEPPLISQRRPRIIPTKAKTYYKLPWFEQVRYHFNNLTRLQKIIYYAFAAPILCLGVIGIFLFFVGGFPWSFNATKSAVGPLLQKVALFNPSGSQGRDS